MSIEIPEKCKKCIYKMRKFCKYHPNAEITTLDAKNCKMKVSVYEVKMDEIQLKRSKMSLEIPEKCKKCLHRLKDYCKAYKAKLEILSVDGCQRKKTNKSRKLRRKKNA